MTSPLFSVPLEEAERVAVELGGKAYHARTARREALVNGVLDYESMTSLPRGLRAELAGRLPILSGREVHRTTCDDGTIKLLIEFPQGASERSAAATVECVYIPPSDRKSKKGATLCVSTQVGCPVACPFCASGRDGLVRNLEAHEILEQYLRGRALGEISRSVVMGIGEPLLNFPALASALQHVHDDLGLGARKVTVSTVGFPERVRRVAATRPAFQLAISLHTPDDAQRDVLVPAMRGVPIEDVLAAGDDWFEATGREVTYEYVLLGGENDSEGHAQRLARRLVGRRCTVNLIPFNEVPGSGYRGPRDVNAFKDALTTAGVVTTVRWSRGTEAQAACGQLRIAARA